MNIKPKDPLSVVGAEHQLNPVKITRDKIDLGRIAVRTTMKRGETGPSRDSWKVTMRRSIGGEWPRLRPEESLSQKPFGRNSVQERSMAPYGSSQSMAGKFHSANGLPLSSRVVWVDWSVRQSRIMSERGCWLSKAWLATDRASFVPFPGG
ncbi:hypothetical protein QAD02_016887 [Eretmocerus hayati]|uniref:Uncharacterized protein n=1 Tax=Eretmocerus hayati TaxID=131215 RepID=A0ACC2PBU8_9HYME|nr:hypothetical protein QAD02_016887 [Eretmocerus hayati]